MVDHLIHLIIWFYVLSPSLTISPVVVFKITRSSKLLELAEQPDTRCDFEWQSRLLLLGQRDKVNNINILTMIIVTILLAF